MTPEHPERKRPLSVLKATTRDIRRGAEGSAWNRFQAYPRAGLESWLAIGTKFTDDPGVFEVPNDARRPGWTRAFRRGQHKAGVACPWRPSHRHDDFTRALLAGSANNECIAV